MSSLIPEHNRTTELRSAMLGRRGRLSRHMREAAEAIQREHAHGSIVAARLDAGAHATRVGLLNTAMLSKDEETLIQFAPLGEARYKAFVDTYAIWAVGELSEL